MKNAPTELSIGGLGCDSIHMSKPKFFRDPLHLQIRFEAIDVGAPPPLDNIDGKISWALQHIIDTEAFQRLRHIRQNGLANFVFHGAEHSRFSHSMGVSHLARRMYSKLCVNSSIAEDDEKKLHVAIASLVHDVGHGPFSHTMEEILKSNDVAFHHEEMTLRFINDEESEIHQILIKIDEGLPAEITKYFDKKMRGEEDDFVYKIVSSQMDADRLDYVQRDAMFSGIRGHGFDIERLLDLMFVSNSVNIAVDRGAIEALEAYLVALDQMWRAVYYHQASRSAAVVVTSLFKRAFRLHSEGDESIFPLIGGCEHPMSLLFIRGKSIPLPEYMRLTDATVWSLIDQWRFHSDPIISDLSDRIASRRLLKSIEIDPGDLKGYEELKDRAKKEVSKTMPDIADASDYYVVLDDAARTSYKTYDWKPDAPNDSIWLTGDGKPDCPMEEDDASGIVSALKNTRRFDRLFVPNKIRDALTEN